MNSKKRNDSGLGSPLAMWGIPQQPCNQGNAMVATTTMSSASAEALANELFAKIMGIDADQTIQFDRRSLGELDPDILFEQAKNVVRANPALSLSSELTPEDIMQKSGLVKKLNTGRNPQIDEELTRSIRVLCMEAGQLVCEQFDLASRKAPSKVDGVIDDLLDGIDQMGQVGNGGGGALAHFEKRIEQLRNLPHLQGEMKEATFRKLKNRLLEKSQSEYFDVLDQWTKARFQFIVV